jgi:hypothetical protein
MCGSGCCGALGTLRVAGMSSTGQDLAHCAGCAPDVLVCMQQLTQGALTAHSHAHVPFTHPSPHILPPPPSPPPLPAAPYAACAQLSGVTERRRQLEGQLAESATANNALSAQVGQTLIYVCGGPGAGTGGGGGRGTYSGGYRSTRLMGMSGLVCVHFSSAIMHDRWGGVQNLRSRGSCAAAQDRGCRGVKGT